MAICARGYEAHNVVRNCQPKYRNDTDDRQYNTTYATTNGFVVVQFVGLICEPRYMHTAQDDTIFGFRILTSSSGGFVWFKRIFVTRAISEYADLQILEYTLKACLSHASQLRTKFVPYLFP